MMRNFMLKQLKLQLTFKWVRRLNINNIKSGVVVLSNVGPDTVQQLGI